jgi:hypothetical protein
MGCVPVPVGFTDNDIRQPLFFDPQALMVPLDHRLRRMLQMSPLPPGLSPLSPLALSQSAHLMAPATYRTALTEALQLSQPNFDLLTECLEHITAGGQLPSPKFGGVYDD